MACCSQPNGATIRAGHCAFTPAETITAVQVLVSRLDTGRWDLSALDPASLNA